MENPNELLTPKQVIDILPFGRDKVYKLFRSDGFPSTKVGGVYVIRRAALNEWWEQNEGKKVNIG